MSAFGDLDVLCKLYVMCNILVIYQNETSNWNTNFELEHKYKRTDFDKVYFGLNL